MQPQQWREARKSSVRNDEDHESSIDGIQRYEEPPQPILPPEYTPDDQERKDRDYREVTDRWRL